MQGRFEKSVQNCIQKIWMEDTCWWRKLRWEEDDHVPKSETTSLNCGHQRAYCTSPRCYISTENSRWKKVNREKLLIRLPELSVNPNSRIIWQQAGEMGEEYEEFCPVKYFYSHKWLPTRRKILRHEPSGFTSPPKEGVLRIFIALKSPSTWLGLNPQTLGPMASTLTILRPRRLRLEENIVLNLEDIFWDVDFFHLVEDKSIRLFVNTVMTLRVLLKGLEFLINRASSRFWRTNITLKEKTNFWDDSRIKWYISNVCSNLLPWKKKVA
jgi:hypothetical protein